MDSGSCVQVVRVAYRVASRRGAMWMYCDDVSRTHLSARKYWNSWNTDSRLRRNLSAVYDLDGKRVVFYVHVSRSSQSK